MTTPLASHLTLADDYARNGDWARAMHHLREALRLAIREQRPQWQLSTIMNAIEHVREV